MSHIPHKKYVTHCLKENDTVVKRSTQKSGYTVMLEASDINSILTVETNKSKVMVKVSEVEKFTSHPLHIPSH